MSRIEESDELLRDLGTACVHLEPDALRVLVAIAKRLNAGQRQYGRLNIAEDRRDMQHELVEELLDGMVYGTVELMRRGK